MLINWCQNIYSRFTVPSQEIMGYIHKIIIKKELKTEHILFFNSKSLLLLKSHKIFQSKCCNLGTIVMYVFHFVT